MSFAWGIIGFGWVARDHFLPGALEAGHRVSAVADPAPEASAAAAGLGLICYDSAGAMLAAGDIDAVYVATPNHLHAEAVIACAAAGKPVLCEKPMAATLADAETIAAAVRASGVPYGTAFDQRHHPVHAEMRRLIAGGAIGTVTAVRIAYACWLDADFAPCAGHENWRIDAARAGGGALIDLAPHGLDLVDMVLGEPLIEVAAMLQTRVQPYAVDDGAMLIGRTAEGVLVSLHVAYNMPDALPRRRLEITGSTGMLVAENSMGQTAGGSLTRIDGATGAVEALAVPDAGASPFARQAAAFARFIAGSAPGSFDLVRDLVSAKFVMAR